MPTKKIDLSVDKNGKQIPVDVGTGQRYIVLVVEPTLLVEHTYHDNSPVVGAPFELELENEKLVKGKLGENGKAKVVNLPSPAKRIRFGVDIRDYRLPPPHKNTEYKDSLDNSDSDAMVERRHSGTPPDAKRKIFGSDAFEWIWGTVQGNFNQQQTTSQIIVDAIISAIPLVGEATDLRDLIAIVLGMVDEPKKREDKWEWLALVVTLLALIPVLGGALKGVGKLLIRSLKTGSKIDNAIGSFLGALNKVGWGNSQKWFKALDLEKFTPEILGAFRKLTQHVSHTIDAILRFPKWVLHESLIVRLRKVKEGFISLASKAEAMIPGSVKELNRKLKEVQNSIHEGEWIPVKKDGWPHTKSLTRETEITFETNKYSEKKLVAKNPKNPPSDPKVHFQIKDGWPNLRNEKFKSKEGDFEVIQSFSGPIKAVRLSPGTRIYRVLNKKSNPANFHWSYTLPKTGKQWREEFAVLENWNKNGHYIEYIVPQEGLVVWEGKVAGQLDNVRSIENKTNPNYGQYLEGGATQLVIDFKFSANRHAWRDVRETPWHETNWSKEELKGVNVPKNMDHLERKLDEYEVENKRFLDPFTKTGEITGMADGLYESVQEEGR